MEYTLINPVDPSLSPIEQVLVNRGIKKENISHFLNVTNSDNLSPLKLKNIDRAVQILCKHIMDEDASIHVQVDSDCDGITSAACLLNYVYQAFPTAIGKFTYDFHDDKGHGIVLEKMPPWTTLVIAPDSSSNEYEIHKTLHDRGIDVIVLDHHIAEEESPYACIVNNQMCDYPNKALSGVGIVYKFCQRIDELMGTEYANSLVDLVAVGLN